jgi:hypothetical protein
MQLVGNWQIRDNQVVFYSKSIGFKFVQTFYMTTAIIKQKLHNYLEVADSKKLKALYTIIEDIVEDSSPEYSKELKADLNKRTTDLKLGKAKTISASESKKRIQEIIRAAK